MADSANPLGLLNMRGCPCGEDHLLSKDKFDAFHRATAGLPPSVPLTVEGSGTWQVPRVYIALHGIAASEVPALAERYGWPRVEDGDG